MLSYEKIFNSMGKTRIGRSEFDLVQNVFKKDMFNMGNNVKLFVHKMSNFCNSKYAIAISNGTVALDIALKAIGIVKDLL